ncbi:MAG: hypothetical protein H7Y04_08960 [Verrucomicrobia bacterium]|nr:hypothetical protein [Cytophagales bacterium]
MADNLSSEFNENVGDFISDETAKGWIEKFEKDNPNEIHSYFFGSKIFLRLFSQPNCVGVRIYNAINEKGEQTIVLAAASENGGAIQTLTLKMGADDEGGSFGNHTLPCPNYCPRG